MRTHICICAYVCVALLLCSVDTIGFFIVFINPVLIIEQDAYKSLLFFLRLCEKQSDIYIYLIVCKQHSRRFCPLETLTRVHSFCLERVRLSVCFVIILSGVPPFPLLGQVLAELLRTRRTNENGK